MVLRYGGQATFGAHRDKPNRKPKTPKCHKT